MEGGVRADVDAGLEGESCASSRESVTGQLCVLPTLGDVRVVHVSIIEGEQRGLGWWQGGVWRFEERSFASSYKRMSRQASHKLPMK